MDGRGRLAMGDDETAVRDDAASGNKAFRRVWISGVAIHAVAVAFLAFIIELLLIEQVGRKEDDGVVRASTEMNVIEIHRSVHASVQFYGSERKWQI